MQRSSKLSKQTRLETGFHGQVAIKCNTKVLDRARQWNDVLPTVIESGKEKERALDFRADDTIVALDFSSFSLSLLSAIQNLMSSIHFCTERKRSGI